MAAFPCFVRRLGRLRAATCLNPAIFAVVTLVSTGIAVALEPAASTAPEQVLKTLVPQHPRLIAPRGAEDSLRQLLRTDEKARQIFESVRERGDGILSDSPIRHRLIGPRLLDQSRLCLDRIYTLATLYRLTGDKKYADRAVVEMRTAAAFPDWNPSHFLDTAEMTHALAIGYDWLYEILSPEDRQAIRTAIVEKGLREGEKIYRRGGGWSRTVWNWNQVCNGGLTMGALAVAEDEPELASFIVSSAIASLPRAMASYAPDGAWAEGPGYWNYATRYTVYMLAGLETALGTDFGLGNSPGFSVTGDFWMHVIGPTKLSFNFADGGSRVGSAPCMLYLAKRFDRPVYAWHERDYLEGRSALDLWWYDPRGGGMSGEPIARWFRGADIVTMRSDWTDDAVFVGFKGGDNAVNHSHLELGSFVLDAAGKRWILDLGSDNYNLPGYFGNLRWTYYRLGTAGQNTLIVDGQNQAPRAKAPITAFSDHPDRLFAVADLSQAYASQSGGEGAASSTDRVRRGVAVLNKKIVVVQDEIQGLEGRSIQWQAHTPAEVESHGREAVLRQEDLSIRAVILSPDDAQFAVEKADAPPPQRQQPDVRKLVVRLKKESEPLRITVAFVPEGSAAKLPPVKPLDAWSTP
ncbi:heparinase II/III domain-containing protein [Thermopirellula anaerolimosa]